MRCWRAVVTALCVGSLLIMGACSDSSNGSDKDAGQEMGSPDIWPDLPGDKDGGIWECPKDQIGKPCNAHDSCAIDPICKPHPASSTGAYCVANNYQDCDDGLECTENICAGQGVCQNPPKEGKCALRVRELVAGTTDQYKTVVKCYGKDEVNPNDQCQVCDPEKPVDKDGNKTDNTGKVWTDKNGGSCDDGNACTKDDYCQAGVCKGTDYSEDCTDNVFCTIDCDGKGGCLTTKPIDPKYCLIGGKCYNDEASNPANCSTCDVAKSQTDWTPTASSCLIGGKCYAPGDPHPGGCAECDPTVDAKAWTVKVSNKCLIDNTCRDPSDQDSIKCGECKPSVDKYAWTPITGKCKIFGVCYAVAEKNTANGGCAECDPAVNANAWTVKGNNCLINNSCKNPLDTDATGCQECAPTTDKYAWSAVAGKCKIGSSCYSDGHLETTGCLTCSYATTPDFWSVNNTVTKQTFDFDSSTTLPSALVYSLEGPQTNAKWQVVSNQKSFSGTNALYYGDASVMHYNMSQANGGAITIKNVALPAGKKAQLVFKTWLDILPTANTDDFKIYVAPSPMPATATGQVWTKTNVPVGSYRNWSQQIIDLSAQAGKTVDIRFVFISYQPAAAAGRTGIFIDDLWLLTDC